MTQSAARPVSLALQGGGAHGAFTWGVLDRLLMDERIRIVAISGCSAGAMNAVVAASGLMAGGPEGACAALARFWRAISDAARFSPVQRNPIDMFLGNWSLDFSPGFHLVNGLSRALSPYAVNPLNINPLKTLLEAHVDFDALRRCEQIRIFISATDVETGRITLFDRHRLTADMVMASACLPQLFQAVEVEGRHYWDGGYSGNPALFPLFEVPETKDIVIVQVTPFTRRGVPVTAHDIQERVNEITFNASLLAELRAIDFVRRMINAGALPRERYRKMRIHMIADEDAMSPLGSSSKLNAEWAFLQHLHDLGHAAAGAWLDRHADDLGRRSTVNLRALLRGG
ncbi:MAG: patatin-like phospholipase family protein [Alphaproteobacteria bacterium]|nr:MAG: patatin-like phospholipase family protein [Alphaproteobacteria bacterium]